VNEPIPPAQGEQATHPYTTDESIAQPQRVLVKLPENPPYCVYTLMGITIFIFLLQMASQYLLNGVDLPANVGMKVNELILTGQYWRFFTPMLLHASFLHIGFNMYALYVLGPGLERHYGHWRFLALYVLAGFAGNVMSFLFSSAASLGASTAIFGLLGAEGVFLYQNRQLFGDRAQKALMNIVFIAVVNLAIGLSPGIDNWGHVGGLLGGILFAWTGGPVLRVEGIFPDKYLADEHGLGDALRAGLSVGLLFSLLAAVSIFLRR
jgi:rhomboid protease GluP